MGEELIPWEARKESTPDEFREEESFDIMEGGEEKERSGRKGGRESSLAQKGGKTEIIKHKIGLTGRRK
jgi:hypothetical protein